MDREVSAVQRAREQNLQESVDGKHGSDFDDDCQMNKKMKN